MNELRPDSVIGTIEVVTDGGLSGSTHELPVRICNLRKKFQARLLPPPPYSEEKNWTKPALDLEKLAEKTAELLQPSNRGRDTKIVSQDHVEIILSALQQVAHVKDAKIALKCEIAVTERTIEWLACRKVLDDEIIRLGAEIARLEAENALLAASQPPPPEPETGTATVMPPGSTPCVELAELQSLLAQSSRDYVEQAKRLADLAAENDRLRKALARYNPKETS